MDNDKIRVIKIGKEALFEFIYESFIGKQEEYLGVKGTEVSDMFDIDWENGNFIFAAFNLEDENGNLRSLPKNIDLKKLMQTLPDTADTMFSAGRYKEYTFQELEELSE